MNVRAEAAADESFEDVGTVAPEPPPPIRDGSRMLLLALGVIVALAVAAPVLVIVASPLLGGDGTWKHLRETVLGTYVRNSVLLAGGAGFGAAVIGASTAWLVTLFSFPGRRVLEWLLLLPLAVPTYLIAYAYTDFLDFAGPVQEWLLAATGWGVGEYWFPEIRSLGGAVVLFAVVLYPYVYLLCRASFLEQSVCLLDASRTLGLSRSQCFRRVGLPLARPAIAGGVALVAMESLADYGAVDYFAVDTFTTGIYRTWFGLGSRLAAAQLSAVLLAAVVVLLVLERLGRRKRRFFQTGARPRELPRWRLVGARGWGACAVCAFPVLGGFGIPLGILVAGALRAGFLPSLAESLEWAWHSFALASLTAVLAVPLSLLLAYNARLAPGWLARSAVRAASLGYAIPGSVVAVGVLLVLGWTDRFLGEGLMGNLLLSGTIGALVFAYLTRFLTLPVHAVEAGLGRITPSMDQAGRTLRAGPLGVLRRIHFPLLRASVLAAGLLVFVEVLKELPATLIVRPFDFDTLAVRTYQLASDERFAEASAPALLIVLTGLLPVLLLSRMMGASRRIMERP